MSNRRFDKRYCDECMINHWLETTNRHADKCLGEDYIPKDTPTHYIKWVAKGIELIQKYPNPIEGAITP